MSTNETIQSLKEANITPPKREVLARGDTRTFDPAHAIAQDVETSLPVVGTVQLPGAERGQVQAPDPEQTMRVVFSNRIGYMLCPPGSRPAVGEAPITEARDSKTMPLNLGNEPGDKVVVGREGVQMTFKGQPLLPIKAGSAVLGPLNNVLNESVSENHLVFEILPDATLQMTDNSTNGTAVETPTV
jgi:hypothetical protein